MIIKSIIATPSSFARFAPINAFLATPLTTLSFIKSIDLILKSIGAAATGAATGSAGDAAGAVADEARDSDVPRLSELAPPSKFSPLIFLCSFAFTSSK